MPAAPDAGEHRGSRHWAVRGTLAVLLAAFVVTLLLGALSSSRRIANLDRRRDEARAAQMDPVDAAGGTASAFRRFRSTVGDGDRFALVFGPEVDRDQQGLYRLVALSIMYPAIAVPDPREADVVMLVESAPSPSIVSRFARVDVVDGVWIGRRRT